MIQTATASPSSAASPPPSQAGNPGPGPDDRATTFQPVEGGGEQHSGSTLLIEAYAVLWVILMAWLVFQWRKQATLVARLDELERAIDRAAAKSAKK